jgi:DNA modification methylase
LINFFDYTWQVTLQISLMPPGKAIVYRGDTLETLRQLPSESFDGAVFSPPYFNLLDYGFEGQHGLEPTIAAYVDVQSQVLRELYRVMAERSTVFVIIGDTKNNSSPIRSHAQMKDRAVGEWHHRRALVPGYREKELLRIPYHYAEAARSVGFCHVAEPQWDKGSARSKTNHEAIIRLAKHTGKGRPYWNAAELKNSVLKYRPAKHPDHPCPLPLGLCQELISVFPERSRIVDPYCGTGVVLEAAIALGHDAVGIDLQPVGFAANITRGMAIARQ